MDVMSGKYMNPAKLQEKIFEKICRVAEIAKMTNEEMAEYENSLKVYRDWYSTIKTARMEGRTEEKIEMTLKMLKDGMSVDMIEKYTGLPKEQIEQLKSEIK